MDEPTKWLQVKFPKGIVQDDRDCPNYISFIPIIWST